MIASFLDPCFKASFFEEATTKSATQTLIAFRETTAAEKLQVSDELETTESQDS